MEYTHGGDIYRNRVKWDFSANIGPFGMPPSVREAAVRGVEDSQAYPDSQAEKLRKEIAQAEGADPEQIVCGNGAAEVIFHLAAAVRPRQALLLAPTFSEYERALTAVGCACHFYELKEENGFQVGEDFPAAITASTDMAVICNPNNPTGVLFPEKLYREVIKRCARTGCLLAVDECFQDFLENQDRLSFRTVWEKETEKCNLFIFKAFTKMYGMPGLRLGYGIAHHPDLAKRVRRASQSWNVSTPAQYAGLAALKETDFAENTRRYVAGERRRMRRAMEEMGFFVYDSRANYLFFRTPSKRDLYEFCLERGLLIRKCSNFRGLTAAHFRVAVKSREENDVLLGYTEAKPGLGWKG